MPYAIELEFDDALAARVRAGWEDLATAGLGRFMLDVGAEPHISLTGFDELDAAALAPHLARLAHSTQRFPVRLSAVGAFPGDANVVFLAPVVSPALLELHRRCHTMLGGLGLAGFELYRPGRWMPHCTMAMEIPTEKVALALERCRHGDLLAGGGAVGEVVALTLVSFRPVTTLHRFALDGGVH